MCNKKIFNRISFIMSATLLFSCNMNKNPVNTEVISSYEIYFLDDENLSYSEISNVKLNKLKLEENPVIDLNSIKSFIVNYLNGNPIQSYHINFKFSLEERLGNRIRPFVLVLNNVPYYIGEYWPYFVNYLPRSVLMISLDPGRVLIEPHGDEANLKLKNTEIIKALEKAGISIEYINIGD